VHIPQQVIAVDASKSVALLTAGGNELLGRVAGLSNDRAQRPSIKLPMIGHD